VIYIFDRYGKLLKQLSPQSLGWDGAFNGEDLPSNDYWFYVKLQDGRIFKSHFTLKR
jgi:gliding motility-associated-like protein